jgi:formylglycine-generating enzyme required for sulfatase activity
VADWYDENYYGTLDDGVVNPIGPVVGDWRALRGGAFLNDPLVARCAYRGGDPPAIPDDYIGFRVAIAILRSP